MMSALKVVEINGIFVVDSRLVADRLNIEHKSFIKTIRKYQALVEKRFGCIRFEIADIQMPNGGTREEVSHAYLTEDQATTIMTFSKNTEIVIECKLDLVESFSKAKEVIKQFAVPQNFAEALRLAADLAEQKQKLVEENQALQVEVQILEPKADRYDLAMSTEGWMTGEEIVKQLNVPKLNSTRKLYDILRKEKVLFKRPDGTNCPYKEWSANGLAALRNGQCFDGRMRFSPVFSWKGLDRILDILRKHGITPKDKQFTFRFDSSKIVAMKRA